MNSYKLGLYEKAMPKELSWSRKFTAARQAGYDFLELSIDETPEKIKRLAMTSAEKKEILREADENGIAFESICLSAHRKYPLGSSDEAVVRKGLEILKGAVDLAADLGIRTIQLAGYDVYYEPSTLGTQKRFEYNLYKITDVAAQAGVILGFETMETDFMNTTAKAMYYVQRIRSPFLQIYPDIGNITNAVGGDTEKAMEDLQTGSGHLAALHLKETLPGRFREVPFGMGHVDFGRTVREAFSLGVRRYLAEFWYLEGADWSSELARVSRMLRGEFSKLEERRGWI